ncbi:MAG: hypothetical protein ACRDAX_05500 [Propionibacteriaceae bacterium]
MSALLVEAPMVVAADVRKRSRGKVVSPVLVSGFAGSKVNSCRVVPSVAQLRLTSRGIAAIVVTSMSFVSLMTGAVVAQFLAIPA